MSNWYAGNNSTNNGSFGWIFTTGAAEIQPALFTNTQTFYDPTITQTGGTQTLTPDLYTNTQTFYAPTVTTTVTLTPDLYSNAQTFYAPTVSATATLLPALYTNAQTFYSPTVSATYDLTPALYSNAQTFYAPAVTATVTIAPSLFTNAQTFYAPTVELATQILLPDLYTNTQTFFAPTVENSLLTVTRAQALKLLQIHLLHGLGAAPLVVGPTFRTAGAVQQTVTQAGATVVIDTTSAPSSFVGDPGELIEELAALHGLGVSLEVTATTRTAGLISQTMVSAGGVTTVTRV